MGAHLLIKKGIEKRIYEKQLKIDDTIVFDEDLPKNCKFSFVDFAPTIKLYKNEGIKSVDYSEVIGFANKWLLSTDCWDVISCETIEAIIQLTIDKRGEIQSKHILQTYSITGEITHGNLIMQSSLGSEPINFRVKLLRLWIKRFDPKEYVKLRPIIPQIQYKDFVPKLITDNEFENIDSVISRVNECIKNEEINGKVISVQTLGYSAEQDWSIDPESTQSKAWIGKIVYILRIFYVLGPIHEEEIGLADFVPECLSGGNLFKRPKFESQSVLLRKASKWLADNSEINFCNAFSIDVKLKSMVSIDTKQMSITRETGDYLRVLRIAYTKPKDLSPDIPMASALPPPPPVYLESQVFVLHKSYSDIKRLLSEFLSRDEWTAEQQYKWILLNCETVFVLSANGLKSSLETNSDESFQAISSSKLSINRNLFFALKLYYDVGFYGIDQIETKGDPNGQSNTTDRKQSCITM